MSILQLERSETASFQGCQDCASRAGEDRIIFHEDVVTSLWDTLSLVRIEGPFIILARSDGLPCPKRSRLAPACPMFV